MKKRELLRQLVPVLLKALAVNLFVNWSGSYIKLVGFDAHYSLRKAIPEVCISESYMEEGI